MHKLLLYSIAILVAIFFFLPCVEAFNLYDYFPNLVPGQDPGQPDTVYVVCSHQTTNQQVIQVRLKTDNINMFDSIGAALIPLLITADQPGAILDTTVATVFSGTAVINMDFLSSDVYSGGGDPGAFPMRVTLGCVEFSGRDFLGAGDHLIANLVFSLSGPTNICVDSTFHITSTGDTLSMLLATYGAEDYLPAWRGNCCGPVVPTLSEWGLIIFSFLLLASLIFYLRRRTSTI